MKKYFLKVTFLTILFLLLSAISFLPARAGAQVYKIDFITDPQTIKPNEVSGPIKVQFQDSGGGQQPAGETLKMLFESSSVTGEFLSESGNPVSTTVQSGWTSRTFYYRDSSQGTFTITVGIVGKEWSASQQIFVSSDASQNSNTNPAGEVLSASSDSSSNASSGGSTNHVSSPSAQLEVLAGSDRTTSPGSPIWFQATIKKNTTSAGPDLNWSFGDGNVEMGPLVSHSYKYPGDYVVVLSARAGDVFSVSRLKVKVAASNILVSDGDGYLEISNNGAAEVNLFNWKLEYKGKGFIFQPNTIILPHSKMMLDKGLLNMKGLDNSMGISLKNSHREEVFSLVPVREADLNQISKNIESIKNEAMVIQSKITNTGTGVAKVEEGLADLTQVATSVDNIIYEAPKQEGFISKLTNFIKRVFYK